ncbi:hypothetical protein TWF694_000132 [Orbilia ellipsospora]|uniref:Uncharacterized protein n=1 Tax=Orbilia ellipsospora TaxID=2528407 RepID=A0AAV9XMP3_9PEZI
MPRKQQSRESKRVSATTVAAVELDYRTYCVFKRSFRNWGGKPDNLTAIARVVTKLITSEDDPSGPATKLVEAKGIKNVLCAIRDLLKARAFFKNTPFESVFPKIANPGKFLEKQDVDAAISRIEKKFPPMDGANSPPREIQQVVECMKTEDLDKSVWAAGSKPVQPTKCSASTTKATTQPTIPTKESKGPSVLKPTAAGIKKKASTPAAGKPGSSPLPGNLRPQQSRITPRSSAIRVPGKRGGLGEASTRQPRDYENRKFVGAWGGPLAVVKTAPAPSQFSPAPAPRRGTTASVGCTEPDMKCTLYKQDPWFIDEKVTEHNPAVVTTAEAVKTESESESMSMSGDSSNEFENGEEISGPAVVESVILPFEAERQILAEAQSEVKDILFNYVNSTNENFLLQIGLLEAANIPMAEYEQVIKAIGGPISNKLCFPVFKNIEDAKTRLTPLNPWDFAQLMYNLSTQMKLLRDHRSNNAWEMLKDRAFATVFKKLDDHTEKLQEQLTAVAETKKAIDLMLSW